MAQYEKLGILTREQTGPKVAKALRRDGKIPANFYYAGEESIKLALDKKIFRKAVHSGHHIFEIDLDGKEQYVMIKEVQYHPVTDDIIHVDLMRVRRDQKMNIAVPIILEGTPIGVKEGGILTQNLQTLEISCLPSDVPEHIVVDVSDFELNYVMNVNQIKVDDSIEIVTADDMDVLAIVPPKAESLEPEIPTDEELAEAELAEETVEEAPAEEAPAEEEAKEESGE
jgi:large subunit ribosomal protein L25